MHAIAQHPLNDHSCIFFSLERQNLFLIATRQILFPDFHRRIFSQWIRRYVIKSLSTRNKCCDMVKISLTAGWFHAVHFMLAVCLCTYDRLLTACRIQIIQSTVIRAVIHTTTSVRLSHNISRQPTKTVLTFRRIVFFPCTGLFRGPLCPTIRHILHHNCPQQKYKAQNNRCYNSLFHVRSFHEIPPLIYSTKHFIYQFIVIS